MRHFEKTFRTTAEPILFAAAMRDPKHIIRQEYARNAVKCSVSDIEKSDDHHIYEVHSVGFARTAAGVDKSRTEKTIVVIHWDLASFEARWRAVTEHGRNVTIRGSYAVDAADSGSSVTLSVNIDIRMPLIGPMAEKIVEQEFRTQWPKYIRATDGHALFLSKDVL